MRDRPETPLLDTAHYPADSRALSEDRLPQLADELRQEVISAVSVTGGHLGAGLGVVELTVAVHYVGVAFSSGEEFDSSYDRGQPLVFPLGARRVITGWDNGLVGMKVGGRRRLVHPPHLAYGDRGAGGAIGPGETLIFVCDLVGVK